MAVYKLCVLVNIEVQVLFLTRRRGGRGAAEDFAIGVALCARFRSDAHHVDVLSTWVLRKSLTGGGMRRSAAQRPLRLGVKKKVLQRIPGDAAR